ncbi:hypothetical protein [Streptomyces sp. NPDC048172]|uniref:hypothetical protein n=1 Tax=Streptomyces sp. NPDC048172 TaxID=3365505 RepID=UPI00371576B9
MARRSTTPSGPSGTPRSRTPVQVRTRRTFGDVMKAFFAFLALAVLLVAVPGALAYFIGWPLPHSLPSLDAFQDEVSAGMFINVLTVVVWLAWAQFTACVLVEVKAAVSGVGLPARVPGAGPSQMLARQLVAAVLLLGSTAASFAPGIAQLGQSFPNQNDGRTVASAQLLPGQHGAHGTGVGHADGRGSGSSSMGTMGGSDQLTPASYSTGGSGEARKAGGTQGSTKFYRIQPPEGRHHDSLWEISERHLGDGRRYKEVYRLNKDRVQPDGSKLSEASLIRPGWIMEMPADAHGGELVEMPDEAPEISERQRQQIEEYQGNGGNWDSQSPDGGTRDPGTPSQPDGADKGGADRSGAERETPSESPYKPEERDGKEEKLDVPPTEHTPDRQEQSVPERPGEEREPALPDESKDGSGPGIDQPDDIAEDVPEKGGRDKADGDKGGSDDDAVRDGGTGQEKPEPAPKPEPEPDREKGDGSGKKDPSSDLAHAGVPGTGDKGSTDLSGSDQDPPREDRDRDTAGDAEARPAPDTATGEKDTKDRDSGARHDRTAEAPSEAPSAPEADPAPEPEPEPEVADPRTDVRADEKHTPEAEAGQGGDDGGPAIGLPAALIGAPLLAAGLLAALGRRRREALWRAATGGGGRTPAHDFPPPSEPAAVVREALLVGADPGAVRFLDRALRGLSEDLGAQGRTLPVVYAAWLTDQELHLQLSEECGQPPAPWRFGQSASFWSIQRAHTRVDVDASVAPPYPGLVSLGMRGDARLLLNLESVPGLVTVTGEAEERSAMLASLVAELATSGWAERMTLTLVGFGADLAPLAPARVRHVADLPGLLQALETESGVRRSALRGAGQDTVLAARTGTARGDHQWVPHLVVVGTEPTPEEAARLAALAGASDPLGIGFLVSTARRQLPGAVWEFDIAPDGVLRAPQMGLELRAQLLPDHLRAAVVELFAATESAAGGAGEERGPGFRVDLSDGGRPAVYARLLGPYEILGLPEPEESRSGQLHEALALLLLHREGVHPRVLASALWPKGVTDDVRDALVARLRDWLGHDPDGRPRLTVDGDGRLVLSPSVVSDWDVLRTLHHGTTGPGGAALSAAVRGRQLADAMELARGPLLADRAEGRYAWLAHETAEAQHPLIVAETGLALAAEHVRAGEPDRALGAVRSALRTAPADERLWEELLRTAHATGEEALLGEAVTWVTERSAQLHGADRGLPPRTAALLDELAPGWQPAARA